MTLRTVGVRLTAEIGEYQSKLKAASRSTRDFKGELDRASKKGNLDAVATQAAGLGIGLAGVAVAAIKLAADFDKSMSSVAAATHAPKAEIAQLRAAALQAGKDTMYSATQAADGITELAKAGVSTADILSGGLKGALSLAAAGQLDVGKAAEIAASAMTQFKLSGDQIPHVADLLAAGAGKAQGSVTDIGFALSQSGLVAAQFGLSIEDTTGALAEFASAGLLGSDAGTSLKTMLLALANPSVQTRNEMADLGISFYDAQGKFVGLSGVAQVLQSRLKGLTVEQRNQALGQIFGNDAIRAASILYTDGAAGVAKWKGAVNESGYAAATAQKQTDNLAGDIERLKGSLETLAIEGGSGPNAGLRMLAQLLNTVANQFANMNPVVTEVGVVLAGLGGALLLGMAAWIKYKNVVAATQEQLIATGPAGEKAAAGLGRVTTALGGIGLWSAGAEAATLLFNALDKKSANVDKLTTSLQNLANTGQTAGELNKDFGNNFEGLGRIAQFASSAQDGYGHFVNKVAGSTWVFGDAGKAIGNFGSRLIAGTDFDTATQQMQALDTAVTANITGLHDYAKASALWQQMLNKSGLDTEHLAALLPNTYKELGVLSAASEKGAAGMQGLANKAAGSTGKLGDLNSALKVGADFEDEYKTKADSVAGAIRGQAAAFISLSKQLRADTDPAFAFVSAQDAMAKAQKEATKAVKEHGRTSKEARDANHALVTAALDLQEAAGRASSTLDGKLGPALVATLKQAGLTKSQINDVSKEFKGAKASADKYTGKYKAEVSAPGAKLAKKELDLAYTSANGFAGPYVATVSTPGAKQAKKDLDLAYTAANGFAGPYVAEVKLDKHSYNEVTGKLDRLAAYQQGLKAGTIKPGMAGPYRGADGKYFATGGWTGPGDMWQPAGVVHADEFVVQKSARGRLESQKPGALDYMNQTGQWPGYAGGGQVWPFPVNVSKTKVPSLPPAGGAGPGGGQTYHWILDVVRRAFPGLHATSTFRAGAVTLSGNRSYHAVGRAVDFPPSMALAQWVNANYFRATRELITPWNSLNIRNGSRHTYTGDVFAQHAGTGRFKGNAHDHWAMARGGIIPEHVVGVGRSGRTYEFGEAGPERVTPLRGYATGGLVNVARTTASSGSRLDTADAMLSAASAVAALTAALKENGRTWSTATQKGRDNRSALIAGVKAAQDAAKAKYDETGSIKAANRVYDEYVHKLDESMKKMHVNAATRRELIKAYSERPKYDTSVVAPSNSGDLIKATTDHIGIEDSLQSFRGAVAWTKPTFDLHTESGRSELGSLFGFLNAASSGAQSMYEYTGNPKQATAYYQGYISQLRSILIKSGMSAKDADALIKRYGRITLTPKSNRWGGLYEHAATGSLRDAQIAAGGPTQYAWAESSTGGELFAPKNGNLQKTRQEVGWAVANWWGGNVNWGGQGAGKNVTVQATIPITLGAETITQQVEMVVDTALGKVVNAIVYQSA